MKRSFTALILIYLSCSLCWAATDPFLGNWKLDPSKTQLVDEMKVTAAGANKFSFIFDGTNSESIVADGTDQPGLNGTTFSVAIQDAHTWKVVRKQDGREVITAIWKLSEDGNTLRDSFTTPQPNGSPLTINYVYQRTAGTSGFAGTWESTVQEGITAFEMKIQPFENSGLQIGASRKLKFDGKDYASPAIGPDGTISGRRMDDRSLEITDKMNGKVIATEELKLSADDKILTRTIHQVGRSKPNIYVFNRQ